MSCTRRVRRGGGFLNKVKEFVGMRPKSPFTAGPYLSDNEKNITKKIKQLEEGIPQIIGLGRFEGFNTTNVIRGMEKEITSLKAQLAKVRGENTMQFTNNPAYAGNNAVSVGGKRKSRKQRRRRMTRRR